MPDPVPFNERLARTLAERESLLCVGLDPEPERLPERVRALPPAEAVVTFNRQIVEATADLVAAYKPNLAFYEALGRPGWRPCVRPWPVSLQAC